MKRLTRKWTGPWPLPKEYDQNIRYEFNEDDNDYPSSTPIFTKLGEYEDIDEELGIDYKTIFKALKDGAWFKVYCSSCECISHYRPKLEYKVFCIRVWYEKCCDTEYYNLKDYGKTWALTKEELKNDADNK